MSLFHSTDVMMEMTQTEKTKAKSAGTTTITATRSPACLVCTASIPAQICTPNANDVASGEDKDSPKELLALLVKCAAVNFSDLEVTSENGIDFCTMCSAYLKEWSVAQERISKLVLRSNQVKATLLSRLLESRTNDEGSDVKTATDEESNRSFRKTDLASEIRASISKQFSAKVQLYDIGRVKVHVTSKPALESESENYEDVSQDSSSLHNGESNAEGPYRNEAGARGKDQQPRSSRLEKKDSNCTPPKDKGFRIGRRKPKHGVNRAATRVWSGKTSFKGCKYIKRNQGYICRKCQTHCGSKLSDFRQHVEENHRIGVPNQIFGDNKTIKRVCGNIYLYRDKVPFTYAQGTYTCGICGEICRGYLFMSKPRMVQHMRTAHSDLLDTSRIREPVRHRGPTNYDAPGRRKSQRRVDSNFCPSIVIPEQSGPRRSITGKEAASPSCKSTTVPNGRAEKLSQRKQKTGTGIIIRAPQHFGMKSTYRGFKYINRKNTYICLKCRQSFGSRIAALRQHIDEEHIGNSLGKSVPSFIHFEAVTHVGGGKYLYRDKLPFSYRGQRYWCGICPDVSGGCQFFFLQKLLVQHMNTEHHDLLNAPRDSHGPESRLEPERAERLQTPVDLNVNTGPAKSEPHVESLSNHDGDLVKLECPEDYKEVMLKTEPTHDQESGTSDDHGLPGTTAGPAISLVKTELHSD